GLRDEHALEAALARPLQRRAYHPDADLAELAAAYGHGLASGHPFGDGNKRIAFVTMAVFLELNGVELEADEPEVVTAMLALAAGDGCDAPRAAGATRGTGTAAPGPGWRRAPERRARTRQPTSAGRWRRRRGHRPRPDRALMS